MMEGVAASHIRGRLRQSTRIVLRQSGIRQASLMCSRRGFSISQSPRRESRPTPSYTPSLSFFQTTRFYSSSPLGTISTGASSPSATLRSLSAPEHLNDNEAEIFNLLNAELNCTKLEVQDISGGCGSMYGIEVESEKFRGLGILKQQRMVNAVLKEKMDREGWHGVQIRTKVPEK